MERGLTKGLYILSVNGEDVRDATLRDINVKIRGIQTSGRALSLEFEPTAFELHATISRSIGAGYGMVLSSNTLKVVELTREPDGSPGPAELAGVKLGCTVLKVDDQPVRDLITVATLFTSAKGIPLECVFKNPGANAVQLRGTPMKSPMGKRNPGPRLPKKISSFSEAAAPVALTDHHLDVHAVEKRE